MRRLFLALPFLVAAALAAVPGPDRGAAALPTAPKSGSRAAGLTAPKAPAPGPLYVLTVKGVINPVVHEYIADGLEKAAAADAAGVLIRLDTPGGLLDSTRDIVEKMLNAPLPVIVYVAPGGARAASAGVFITLAADIAAMAPQTHLGAAHPVSIGGGPFGGAPAQKSTGTPSGGVMEEKAVSDAAAYIRVLATAKGRNADWAEKAVRESKSLTAAEALEMKVIDVVANDEDALLKAVAGRVLKKNEKEFATPPASATRVLFDMSAVRRFLHALGNPNLAYLLLMIGFYALIYEFSSPGVGFGAAAGVICLVLAFYALQVLPVNYAGLGLLATGIVFMALDLKIPSHGLLTVGGLLCFVLGSLLLFDAAEPYFKVSLELIGGTALATAGFFVFAVKKILDVRHTAPVTGREGLLQEIGEVRPDGMIFVHGEHWSAESAGPLAPGDKVKILEIRGNTLRVEKLPG